MALVLSRVRAGKSFGAKAITVSITAAEAAKEAVGVKKQKTKQEEGRLSPNNNLISRVCNLMISSRSGRLRGDPPSCHHPPNPTPNRPSRPPTPNFISKSHLQRRSAGKSARVQQAGWKREPEQLPDKHSRPSAGVQVQEKIKKKNSSSAAAAAGLPVVLGHYFPRGGRGGNGTKISPFMLPWECPITYESNFGHHSH